ncbi:MAG: hypothetical protein COB09_18900 [Thalassobium sp.]|nr:MAG: hypothetical protein COB09_18900 [Thalassobium sp.]
MTIPVDRQRYQKVLALDTLYVVRSMPAGVEQIAPSIETIGGTVDIYVSQDTPVSAPTGMNIIDGGAAFVGSAKFEYIHNYLWVTQAGGTTTSIIVAGLDPVEVV